MLPSHIKVFQPDLSFHPKPYNISLKSQKKIFKKSPMLKLKKRIKKIEKYLPLLKLEKKIKKLKRLLKRKE